MFYELLTLYYLCHMKKMQPKKIVEYWKKTAAHDYESMVTLYQQKRYSDSLFFGHIVLEKILKALVVQKTKQHSPYGHDLLKLQELAMLELSKEEIDFLDEMNAYNTRTRYPDYKLNIYKLCTREFTKTRLDKAMKLYKKLWKQTI